MKNIESLLNYVDSVNHFSIFGNNKIIIRNNFLTGSDIYLLFEHVKWMRTHNVKVKTEIDIRCSAFKSSDVINVLELLMLYLSKYMSKQFTVCFNTIKILNTNILFINSLLPKFNKVLLDKKYIDKFYEDIYSPTHYRHVVLYEKHKESDLCPLNDTIKYVISNGNVDYDLAVDSAESVIEMVGNVIEHSRSDCIVDIKVCRNIDSHVYVSLNVISLSQIFIGTRLKDYIIENYSNYSGFGIVKKAYSYHSKMFNNTYDIDSFSFVCSFQNRVSTRKNVVNSGGTGFTTLIKNIHNKSFNEEYDSYILSGNNTLYFRNKYLNPDSEGIIGFNDKNDFYYSKPNADILKKEITTFPGTIFCVNLITEYKENGNN